MDIQVNKVELGFVNNKLINPDIIEEDLEDEEEEENIEEDLDLMDDETLEIINRIRLKNINNENNLFKEPEIKKKSSKKASKKTSKKNMSLQEFSKTCEPEKPGIKRFTSNRVEHKKKSDVPAVLKRQFNPRKPPYNFHRKNKIETPQLNNIQEFPELR